MEAWSSSAPDLPGKSIPTAGFDDVSAPVATWTSLTSGKLSADGAFSFTDNAAATIKARFLSAQLSVKTDLLKKELPRLPQLPSGVLDNYASSCLFIERVTHPPFVFSGARQALEHFPTTTARR